MAPPTSDQVQLAVLQTLDASGPIADSRSLVVEGQTMSSAQDQILVKAAVDSLLRREVSLFLSFEAIGGRDDCSYRSCGRREEFEAFLRLLTVEPHLLTFSPSSETLVLLLSASPLLGLGIARN